MSKRGWLYIVVFLVLGILYFYNTDTAPKTNFDENLVTSIDIDTKEFHSPSLARINYSIENKSSKIYEKDKYFYQIVLSRSEKSPGFILSEFDKKIEPHGVYSGVFDWSVDHPIASGGNNFILSIRAFKINEIDEPELVSVSSISLAMDESF